MKFMRYYSVIAVLLFTVSINASIINSEDNQKTDANIIGHVESARTGEHLPYIAILLKGTTLGVETDATGHYFLKDLPLGRQIIVAWAIGYKRVEKEIFVERGKTIEVNFLLEEEAVMLDETVVSATKNETNRRKSASIVNVSSLKLFEGVACSTLSESMSFQPGLRVENNCGNCGITQLRINGLDGQYSQILLDSRPIFSSLSSVYGLEQLPVSMIERVEIVRGGGSALFGASAIGGVVNIITKEPLRNSVSVSNTTNIFENGGTDINTSFNGSFVSENMRGGIYLFGMVRDRDGYDRNGDGFTDIPKINSETIGFRGYYKTSLYSRITAEYHHIKEFRRGGNNITEAPHLADIAEQLNHKIDGGGLKFDINSSDYRHRFGIYTSAQNIYRESYFGAEIYANNYGITKDRTAVAGMQYSMTMDRLLFMPSELTMGIEYTYNDLNDAYLEMEREIMQTTHLMGGFLQNEWKSDKLSFLIGARLDKHNLMKEMVFSPRINFRYSPSDKLGFRVSYSSGYRAPQTYSEDLHVEAVGGELKVIHLDPDLKPEYSNSFSASADIYHAFGNLQTNFLVEGFYTTLNNVFTLDKIGHDDEGNIYMLRRNGDGAVVKGVNLEGKAGIPNVFELQLGYTWQSSRYTKPERWSDDLEPQRKMFKAPDHYGYFVSNFNITKDFKASLFGTYTGVMLVQHSFQDVDSEETTPRFFDMGIKLSHNFRLPGHFNIEINGGVKNIFDSFQRDFDFGPDKDAGYVYGPSMPRLIFIGAKMSF